MSFCETLWDHTGELQAAIVGHPFNRALAAGTLDRDRFAFYLVQDQRYLIGFSRALAVASARSADVDEAAFLARSSHTALVVERGLHADYLGRFEITADEAAAIETAPSALAYTSYLQATAAHGGFPELVAALLPCFWVYEHVGRTILADVGDLGGHPYAAWIETYADDDFAASVATMRGIVDRLATTADEPIRAAMRAAFVRGCEYEWMFWDAAWRREAWPTRRWQRRHADG
ncbi:MAG: thiaminase II [Streptosporangiales bacterium]|nr:thiaminase II [Streptosporangiales bacterium]